MIQHQYYLAGLWCFISNFPAPMWQKSLMISLQSYNYFLPHSLPLLIAVAVTITWTCIFQNTSICFPNEMHAYLYDPQVRATYATVLFKHCFFAANIGSLNFVMNWGWQAVIVLPPHPALAQMPLFCWITNDFLQQSLHCQKLRMNVGHFAHLPVCRPRPLHPVHTFPPQYLVLVHASIN